MISASDLVVALPDLLVEFLDGIQESAYAALSTGSEAFTLIEVPSLPPLLLADLFLYLALPLLYLLDLGVDLHVFGEFGHQNPS